MSNVCLPLCRGRPLIGDDTALHISYVVSADVTVVLVVKETARLSQIEVVKIQYPV